MSNSKKGWTSWKKNVVCGECKDRMQVKLDDLYADDLDDSDGRLMICVTCSTCASVIPVKVSDVIRNLVLKAV